VPVGPIINLFLCSDVKYKSYTGVAVCNPLLANVSIIIGCKC